MAFLLKRTPVCEVSPLLWSSESLGYTIPEGEPGSCTKFKRPIRRSLSAKRCGCLRPVASRLPRLPVSWAFLTARSITGARELAEHGPEAFPGSGHQTALEEENRRLKRELERTRQERDILKKQSVSSRTASCEVPGGGRLSQGL